MSGQYVQKIEPRTRTLPNLMTDLAEGRYRIPEFQRDYVWPVSKVIALFDSIYQEFPIGSFFIWQADAEHHEVFRECTALKLPEHQPGGPIHYILDGQQRLTSLYLTLFGQTFRGVDYSRICFDLDERRFDYVNAGHDGERFISVSEIWGPGLPMLMRSVSEERVGPLDEVQNNLMRYPVSVVEIRDKGLAEVCLIFQRINQGGRRLGRFDLISAMTYRPEFDLRARIQEDLQAPLTERGFGEIAPTVVTQLVALMQHGHCTQKHEFDVRADALQDLWPEVVNAILLAVDTMRNALGVITTDFVPYDAILTLMAYAHARCQGRALSESQMQLIEEWFWKSAFGERFTSAAPTRMGQDRKYIDAILDDQKPACDITLNITVAKLKQVQITQGSGAIRRAFLCLLARKQPVHLVNNTPLDLSNGSISDFTSAEKHHIFPKAFLLEQNPSTPAINALPNFCFLPAELNKKISSTAPSTYFSHLAEQNPNLEQAAASHLIPMGPETGLTNDDYERFLTARAELILEEIGRLCGTITTPLETERHDAVSRIEAALRDRIHETLQAGRGEGYWDQAIPDPIRESTAHRIAIELKKNPSQSEDDYQDERRRLDFCDVSDYVPIMARKANWAHLKAVFGNSDELTHHLRAFAQYRNAVAHNRPMSELARLGGEQAILWFQERMAISPESTQPATETSLAPDQEANATSAADEAPRQEQWTRDDFFSRLEQARGVLAVARSEQLLKWAEDIDVDLYFGHSPKAPSLKSWLKYDGRHFDLLHIWPSGGIPFHHNQFRKHPVFQTESGHRALVDTWNAIEGFEVNTDMLWQKAAQVNDLSEDGFRMLQEVLAWTATAMTQNRIPGPIASVGSTPSH
ncbi:MAG: DUF262 domain-containing protein [Phycisphaerales bacterium]|nr:DUF262 domain-containing protein [Phycisphaerales bacterium]